MKIDTFIVDRAK